MLQLNMVPPDSQHTCQSKRKTISPSVLFTSHLLWRKSFFLHAGRFLKGFLFLSSHANIPFTLENVNRFKPPFKAGFIVQTCYSCQHTMHKHTGAKIDRVEWPLARIAKLLVGGGNKTIFTNSQPSSSKSQKVYIWSNYMTMLHLG